MVAKCSEVEKSIYECTFDLYLSPESLGLYFSRDDDFSFVNNISFQLVR